MKRDWFGNCTGGRGQCVLANSPSDVVAPSWITGGGEPSPHEGGPIRNCLRWEPRVRGELSRGCSCPGQARPFRVALPLGPPLGPAHSPSCGGVVLLWFLLAVHWFSLQQVRSEACRRPAGPSVCHGGSWGFSPRTPPHLGGWEEL